MLKKLAINRYRRQLRFIPFYLDVILVMAIVIFGWVLYSRAFPEYYSGYADADDLTLAGLSGGLAHPPGYPIHMLIFHLITRSGLFNEPVKGLHLVGAFFQILSGVILFLVLIYRFNSYKLAAFLATILWMISPLTWVNGAVVEVFPLAQLFLLMFIWVYLENKTQWWQISLAIFAGISHQITLIPIGLIIGLKRKEFWWKKLAKLFILVLGLMASLYIYSLFPLAENSYSWPIKHTIEGYLNFFLRRDYTQMGSQIETYVGVVDPIWAIKSLGLYFEKLTQAFSGWGVWFICLGLLIVIKKRTQFKLPLFIIWLATGPLLTLYMKLPVVDKVTEIEFYWGMALRERMFFVSRLLETILLCLGLNYFAGRIKLRKLRILIFSILIGVSLITIPSKQGLVEKETRAGIEELVRQVLKPLPRNAKLLVDSDLVFSMLLEQRLFQNREDVEIIGIRLKNLTTVKPKWFDGLTNQNELIALEVAEYVNQGEKVFLFSPDMAMLEWIGGLANPFYAIPYGYTIEIAKKPPTEIGNFDYELSKRAVNRGLSDSGNWFLGYKAQLSIIHALAANLFARNGYFSMAETHQVMATELVNWVNTKSKIEAGIKQSEKKYYLENAYFNYVIPEAEEYLKKAQAALANNDIESAHYFASRVLLINQNNKEAFNIISYVLRLENNYADAKVFSNEAYKRFN